MRRLHEGRQFQKDFEKVFQNAPPRSLKHRYKEIITALMKNTELPHYFNAHPLKGEWEGCLEGHVKSDVLLIYQATETDVYLVRIGSHSELFE